MVKPNKISKQDISHPTPLQSNAEGLVITPPTTQTPPPALIQSTSTTPRTSMNSSISQPAIPSFQDVRLDASASIVGSPLDPRVQRQHLPPPKMDMRQLQGLVQAVGAYRRQIQALSAASDMFVRALEDVLDVVPTAKITRKDTLGDLDFLIDSTHLISNSHQIWAEALEREFEQPLMERISNISLESKKRETENKLKMEDMVKCLREEEERSYKLGKKKQRDLDSLQNSLVVRMKLADEIKRLSIENHTLEDTLAHQSVSYILDHTGVAIRNELENYDRIMEGLKKLGAFQPEIDSRARESVATCESTEIVQEERISTRETVHPSRRHVTFTSSPLKASN